MTGSAASPAITVALRFAYDGSAFDSYARQPGRRTVEAALLDALRGEGGGSLRTGSRTDAGVSALANVAAAVLHRPHLRGLVPALQARCPPGLWVTGAAAAPAGFDPRRAAWREYRYLAPSAGEELGRMRAAAALFLGTHDVRAFARLEAHRSPVRTVARCTVAARGRLWELRVRGASFLWSQVRRMAGAILAVGRGDAEPGDIRAALETGMPHPRFTLAPAEGLRLHRVEYPGLEWDQAAGGIQARQARALVAPAQVRLDLVQGLLAGAQSGRLQRDRKHDP